MQRVNVIIYVKGKKEDPECYGNLKLFCATKGVKYNTFSRKKMPFEFNGGSVHRVPFISGSIINFKGVSAAEAGEKIARLAKAGH